MKKSPAAAGAADDARRFDCLIFVGRFQPFHFGHLRVIEAALRRADHVLVLVGSANLARNARNPFTYDERQRMIVDALHDLGSEGDLAPSSRTIVKPLDDHLYNDEAWIAEVQRRVRETLENDLAPVEGERRVGLIGHAKHHTSYYLRIFPNYEAIDVPAYPDRLANPLADDGDGELSATSIRERMYDHALAHDDRSLTPFRELAPALPVSVRGHLERIWHTRPFQRVLDEVAFVREYRKAWACVPYEPTFNTVDAVVVNAGHVLMVVRGGEPGRGLLALPGGFVNPRESLLDACVRETYEETQLNVPRRVLLGALASNAPRTFDDPYRSARGRTFTHAFRFDLRETELPKVKGGDDAARALWMPLGAIEPTGCFEDHAFIIRTMLGVA